VEPGCDEAARHLQHGVLIAPDFLELEFTNVCVMKQRFNKATPAQVATAAALRQDFKIELFPIEHRALFNLAIATGLTAYDASYLLLARNKNAELVTLDQKLNTAFLSAIGR
jgi:predicted nucleic acid-binding protein